jgi:hypothetical protein
MSYSLHRRTLLLCATALSGLLAGHTAHAQTAGTSDTQIQSIQQQIKSLQSELNHMRADLSARDTAVKAAQAKAVAAQQQAAAAAASAAAIQAAAPPIATQQVVAGGPSSLPKLGQGQFQVGALTVTLGGFAAAEGIDRSRNLGSSIDSSFNSIPFANNPNNHTGEFRETAQQSRFSLLTEGQIDAAQKLTGYLETDFLSAGSSSNSNQSNSYTLRLRQFWGNYDNTDWGLHILGGQAWSLATMYRQGLIPRQENVPLSIDAQYVVGFDWARQAQLRVVKDFDDHKLWAGLSLEEPQTIFGSSAGPNCLTGANTSTATGGGTLEDTECGGSNVNSIQAQSDNIAPDIIAKIAADPGWGHYELYGLLRFFNGRTSFATTGTGSNTATTGEGIGGAMLLPIIPKKLEFQLSGLVGKGVGRYGTSQLADVTFNPSGKIEPLSEYSVMGGIVGHPIPEVDLYGYAGAEGVDRKAYSGTAGYGNSTVSLAGCEEELGTCSAVTSSIVEGTVGGWWRPIKSPYGTVQLGVQYEYVNRTAFSGVGATKGSVITPSANENMFLFSVRYYPFQ